MAANNGLVFPSPWKLTMSSFSLSLQTYNYTEGSDPC
jgi:hypothetical protein